MNRLDDDAWSMAIVHVPASQLSNIRLVSTKHNELVRNDWRGRAMNFALIHDCPWNETTCDWAAKRGYLQVLKWAREMGCAWTEATCIHAAEGGHMKLLLWACENQCPCDDHVITHAILVTSGMSGLCDYFKCRMNYN
jgi:hypothetical protein